MVLIVVTIKFSECFNNLLNLSKNLFFPTFSCYNLIFWHIHMSMSVGLPLLPQSSCHRVWLVSNICKFTKPVVQYPIANFANHFYYFCGIDKITVDKTSLWSMNTIRKSIPQVECKIRSLPVHSFPAKNDYLQWLHNFCFQF